jgi:hypothetical protein
MRVKITAQKRHSQVITGLVHPYGGWESIVLHTIDSLWMLFALSTKRIIIQKNKNCKKNLAICCFIFRPFLFYQVKSENTAVKGRESKPHGIPVEIYDREHYPRESMVLAQSEKANF